MSGVRVAMRLGAAVTTIGLLGGVVASPAVSADTPRGENAWWYTAMKLADAHNQTTGKGVTIGLIDSPVDPKVPELKSQNVVPVANTCGGEATGTGEDADHGTSMAAFIVGSGKGNPSADGVAGVAPDATLRTYATETVASKCNQGVQEAIAAAIDRAVADKVQIISLSQGSKGSTPSESAAVQRALAAGVVIVAATGQAPDDTSVIFPASEPGVVAVAAVDKNAKPWTKNVAAGRDKFVISAPGVDVPGAGFDGDVWRSTLIGTGTSPATAITAGALALVMAKYPKATGNQVIQQMIHNPGGTQEFGKTADFGYGILSVANMLATNPTKWPDVNPLLSTSSSSDGASAAPSTPADTVDASPTASKDSGGGNGAMFAVLAVVIVAVLVGGGFFVARSRSRG